MAIFVSNQSAVGITLFLLVGSCHQVWMRICFTPTKEPGQEFYGLLCGWAQEFHRVFLCEQTGFMKISLLRAEHVEGDGGLGGRARFTSEGGDMT